MTRQSGYLLISVVVTLFIISAVTLMMSQESVMQSHMVNDEQQNHELRYVTEAAMQHAEWQLQQQGCGPFSDLASTSFGNHSYTATVTPNNPGGQITSYSVAVSDDALIKQNTPTQNYGNVAQLETFADFILTDVRRALYRFDIASAAIPAGSTVLSATLRLFVIDANSIADVSVHQVTADWTEGTVNWDNINDSHDTSTSGIIPLNSPAGQFVEVNITPLVQGWVNGSIANQGIMLKSTTNLSDLAQFSSKEYGTTSQRPELIIKVSDGSLSTRADISATGTLASGSSLTVNRKNIALHQSPPSSVSLQLGTEGGEDAMLDSFYDKRNYGGADYLQVHDNGSDWQQYPLIRFNLDGLPHGASVLSAQLELNLQSLNAPGKARIHQVMQSWVEGTKAGGGTADGATWFTHDGNNAWTTAGGDFNPEVIAETAINGGETWVSWEIASLVQRWLAGEPNYGLMIKPDSALKQANFASSENANAGVQPKLTITYSCECGIACQAPAGSGKLLLVVGDDATLSPSDALKKNLFEEWGYTITLLDDQAQNQAFSDALLLNDVAYISESTDPNRVWDKLTGTSIGVINEEGGTNSFLGTSSSFSNSVGKDMDVIDTSHYITSLFPAGRMPVYSANMENLQASGTLAAGLQTLGNDLLSTPILSIIETGGLLADGSSSAPGRRVMLPLGREANFNWDYLNNNGRLIVQRAIQWGTGNIAVTPVGNLLLVVVNPASLTTQEAARKAQIESWGYTVNLIDDNDSQTNFDAAIASNDVAYVPTAINATALGSKLTAATIGVVIEEWTTEFGIATDFQPKDRDELDIIDNSHYITSPFSLGLLTYLSSLQPVTKINSGLAPDLIPLGMMFNTGTQWKEGLAVINADGSLASGGSAAGRRVQLPWGDATFDVTALNADGLTIMQRAIEWGAGAGTTALTGPIAHWKLDETSGLTALDSVGGHDGILGGGPPVWTTGYLDGGLEFNGVDDYVDLTSDTELDDVFVGGATVMAWIRPTGWGENGYGRIFDKSSSASSTGDGWVIRMNVDNGGTINFGQGFTSGRGWWKIPNSSISLNTWQHITVAYDANSTTNDPLIYLDGSPVSVTSVDTPSGSVRSDAAINLRLGNYAGGTTHTFAGKIDDARIYDRMLDAAEIAAIATGGGGGPSPANCDGTYRDEFNARIFSGSDGSIDWSTSPWAEVGESDGPTKGDEQMKSDLPTPYQLQIRDNDNGGEGVERQVDLSGAGSAILSFDYRRMNLDNSADYVSVYISSTGTAGPWTELDQIGTTNDTVYQNYSRDISSFISTDTVIRLLSSPDLGNLDVIWFDNIQIQCSP